MEVNITNSWLFREYLSAINENLGILATIFIAISRGLVAIKARFLVRDITREQRRFGGFLVNSVEHFRQHRLTAGSGVNPSREARLIGDGQAPVDCSEG